MSDKLKDGGGPAYPFTLLQPEIQHSGMSLRDYFAAKAVSALMLGRWEDKDGYVPSDIFSRWAKSAYAMADAMLAERGKE